MAQLFINNFSSSLGASATNVATTITLATGAGASLPSPSGGDFFYLTLAALDVNLNENLWEIVKCTGRATDVCTVARGQDGTTAVAWGSGSRIEARPTKATMEGLAQLSGAAFTGVVNFATGANIASASTINLTTATGNLVHITGTTPITAVTLGSGMFRTVIFDGALTLTHHATNNNLPGGANITTAAGDRAIYASDGTTVRCVSFVRANGFPSTDMSDFAQDTTTTTGLTYGHKAGRLRDSTGQYMPIAAGTVAVANSAVNYVMCDNGGTVTANTTGWTSNSYPMAFVTTSGGAITDVTDARAPLMGTPIKDISGGFVGLTNYKINMWDSTKAYKSFLQNSNTASRTYTFPDWSGNMVVTDANGNIALGGTTLAAWQSASSTSGAIQMGLAAFWSNSGAPTIGNNVYKSSGNAKYISTAVASRYYQLAGDHVWQAAVSGTADADITFTTPMSLSAAGVLGLTKTTASSITYPFTITNADSTNNGAGVGVSFITHAAGAITGKIENVRDSGGIYSLRLGTFINGAALTETLRLGGAGGVIVEPGLAIPAGGTVTRGLMFSTTANFGVFFGSGAPTLTAAKGSLYLRSDGSSTSTRMYVNTDGGTTWTAVTTAA